MPEQRLGTDAFDGVLGGVGLQADLRDARTMRARTPCPQPSGRRSGFSPTSHALSRRSGFSPTHQASP